MNGGIELGVEVKEDDMGERTYDEPSFTGVAGIMSGIFRFRRELRIAVRSNPAVFRVPVSLRLFGDLPLLPPFPRSYELDCFRLPGGCFEDWVEEGVLFVRLVFFLEPPSGPSSGTEAGCSRESSSISSSSAL